MDTNLNEKMSLDVVVDLKDTFFLNVDNCVSNEELLYSDEEVSYEKLQEKYTLVNTK